MASFTAKIRAYLEANGKNILTEKRNESFQLQNNSDGQGPSISSWNVSGVAQPTQEQLDALDSQAGTLSSNEGVRTTRRLAYGDIGEQLDEIFKDIDAWKTRIQGIKNANPKS